MSRAYLVYLVMFAALIGGMVLIMTAGESVRAPDDLSGNWVVEWDNAPPPESGEPKLRIEQSGRFFVVRFGQHPPMNMKLQDGWTGKTKGRRLHMRLAGPPWELRLNGDVPPAQRWRVPEMNLELVGPTRHVGIARRVLPTVSKGGRDGDDDDEDDAPAAAPDPAPARAGEPAKAAVLHPATADPTAAPTAAVPSEPDHAR
jgi:hypothetical protein